jgi:FkbM family methyltransferase
MKEPFKHFILTPAYAMLSLSVALYKAIGGLFPSVSSTYLNQVKKITDRKTACLQLPNGFPANIKVHTPNRICAWRSTTVREKEPELLDWLKKHSKESVFFDIGANIGLYALIFSSFSAPSSTFAFEPSPMNLRQLALNVNINNLQDKITVLPIALSCHDSTTRLVIPKNDEGGAMNNIKSLSDVEMYGGFNLNILQFGLDSLIEKQMIPPPNIMKIDIDGGELPLLQGALETLNDQSLRSIYLEIDYSQQSNSSKISQILASAGFTLTWSDMKNPATRNRMINTIWDRS